MTNAGRLAGIARHSEPGGPIETLEAGEVTRGHGLKGDMRGGLKGKPYRRQISLIETEAFARASAEAGAADVRWSATRRNLLVDGFTLQRAPGTWLRIGESCLLEITGECTPCARMDGVHPGLQAALTPDWRGGALAMVIEPGRIAIGDEIRIE
ncbi:MOSC domain-containing protein [Citromicrobium bathyomarinum]|jgi:MOSC domain-containing protein YiiM|uniref:MOSC domain-containing protein n=1 Tax=Sphingomonadales TaxID=204457 RepID=UPI000C637416|nr:MOSC domain-containing protein [Citromicrobium sp.]MBO82297.1 MOSC domain-containing protein [Citromicrobium sp.]|tara:strand:- start:24992 stop:25453 length:462 start_codon:yes stop_codon:yes gene_type:complete